MTINTMSIIASISNDSSFADMIKYAPICISAETTVIHSDLEQTIDRCMLREMVLLRSQYILFQVLDELPESNPIVIIDAVYDRLKEDSKTFVPLFSPEEGLIVQDMINNCTKSDPEVIHKLYNRSSSA